MQRWVALVLNRVGMVGYKNLFPEHAFGWNAIRWTEIVVRILSPANIAYTEGVGADYAAYSLSERMWLYGNKRMCTRLYSLILSCQSPK